MEIPYPIPRRVQLQVPTFDSLPAVISCPPPSKKLQSSPIRLALEVAAQVEVDIIQNAHMALPSTTQALLLARSTAPHPHLSVTPPADPQMPSNTFTRPCLPLSRLGSKHTSQPPMVLVSPSTLDRLLCLPMITRRTLQLCQMTKKTYSLYTPSTISVHPHP